MESKDKITPQMEQQHHRSITNRHSEQIEKLDKKIISLSNSIDRWIYIDSQVLTSSMRHFRFIAIAMTVGIMYLSIGNIVRGTYLLYRAYYGI